LIRNPLYALLCAKNKSLQRSFCKTNIIIKAQKIKSFVYLYTLIEKLAMAFYGFMIFKHSITV